MRFARTDTSNNEIFPTEAWRLLLPDPAPDVVVALGSGPVADIARRVMGAVDRSGAVLADLVVADNFDLQTLRTIPGMLAPGGVAYLQAPTSMWRGTGPMADALHEAGFDDVQCYALSPGPGRWDTSWWIPTGAPAAIRFVARSRLNHRVSGRAVRMRAANFVNRVAAAVPRSVSSRPWLLHPNRQPILCVVAVVDDDNGRDNPASGLARDAIAAASAAGAGRSAPHALMRAGGSSTDQPVLLVFGKTGGPVAVVKAPVLDEEIESTGLEAQTLAMLNDLLPPGSGVPRSFALPSYRGLTLAGQTFVGGSPLAHIVEPDTFGEFGALVAKWTIDFATATAQQIGPRDLVSHLDRIVAELRETIGSELADRALVTARAGLELVDVGVAHHRDLGPWNVHYDKSTGIGVIDWADAVRSGPPLGDLAHHLVHLALCANDGYEPGLRAEIINQVVDRSQPLGAIIGELEDDYARSLGISLDAVRSLRILTWLIDIGRQEPEGRAEGIYVELLKAELDIAANNS